MTRIVLLEGDIADQEVDAIVHAADSALALDSGVAGAIAARAGPWAEREGCRSVALPAIGAGDGGLSLQQCAEISLEEARRVAQRGGEERGGERGGEEGGAIGLEEIRFVLLGEPVFRVFEMANDAAKIEAQMRRLRGD